MEAVGVAAARSVPLLPDALARDQKQHAEELALRCMVALHCVMWLLPAAPRVPGVFRVPADQALVARLRVALFAMPLGDDSAEPGRHVHAALAEARGAPPASAATGGEESASDDDVHAVVGALKLILNELPEPLVPRFHHVALESLPRPEAPSAADALKFRERLDAVLDPAGYLLYCIFGLLFAVSLNSSTSLMTPANLAAVLAPTLFRPSDFPSLRCDIEVITFICANYELVYPTGAGGQASI